MRASVLAVASLLAATGCTKSGDAKPVAKPTKRERCEAIAGQAAQSAGLAIGLMASSMAEDGKGLSGEELSAGTRDMKAELLAECMTWDDAVLDCFKPFAMLNDQCERVLAEALGQTVAPDDAPEGPVPAWTLELPGTVRQIEADDGGRVGVAPAMDAAVGPTAAAAAVAESARAGVAGRSRSWHARHVATYMSAPPMSSTVSSRV